MRNDDYGTRQFLYPEVVPPTPDFDLDGAVDGVDVDELVAVIVAGSHDPIYDLTADATVDVNDLDEWLRLAGAVNLASQNSYILGDANLDGTVDGAHFEDWNQYKFTATAAWTQGDFTADGFVDGHDLLVWNTHKFTTALDRRAVPEPQSMLATVGLAFWMLFGSTNRSRKPLFFSHR